MVYDFPKRHHLSIKISRVKVFIATQPGNTYRIYFTLLTRHINVTRDVPTGGIQQKCVICVVTA
jgi:hypothetical protein